METLLPRSLGDTGNTPCLDHHEKIGAAQAGPGRTVKGTITEKGNISSTLFVIKINQWNSLGKINVDIIGVS